MFSFQFHELDWNNIPNFKETEKLRKLLAIKSFPSYKWQSFRWLQIASF